jgi:thymidylate kinase
VIVELFGPPAVGKTTFARALAARLRECGHDLEVLVSARPAECLPMFGSAVTQGGRWCSPPLQRLSRPVIEAVALLRQRPEHRMRVAAGLLEILPPRNIIWAVRLRQYIWRLSRAWQRASAVSHVVLFDQGFIQALCSLALLGRRTDESLFLRALDSAPKSDLFIRLDAPAHVLESRLRDRACHQGAIERILELDLQTNLASIAIIDKLDDLLRQRGHNVIRAFSLDPQSLRESVNAIGQQLSERMIGTQEIRTG